MGNKLFLYKSTDSKGNNADMLAFKCIGCGREHFIDPKRWTFNGDYEKPTLAPSILVTWSHPKGYSNDNPAPKGWDGEMVKEVCHSFVREGKIQFLGDCTHELKNQTIDLPDINLEDWKWYR